MYKNLTVFCCFLSVLILGLGAYTHLSKGDLGCPDWPTCYGEWVFSSFADLASKAKAIAPDRAFNLERTLAEISYRYLVLVQAIFLVLIALLSGWQRINRLSAVTKSWLLLVLISLQLGCSRWLTTSLADPAAITALNLLAMLVFWRLFDLCLYGRPQAESGLIEIANKRLMGFNRFAMLVVFLQIAYATGWLAYGARSEYHGMAWHQTRVYFAQFAFVFDSDTAKQWLYLGGVASNFIVLASLAFFANAKKQQPWLRGLVLTAILLLLAVSGLGVYGYWFGFSVWLVVAHTLTSALLMLPLVAISCYGRFEYQPAGLGAITVAAPSLFVPEKPMAEPRIEPKPGSLYTRLTTQLQRTRGGLGSLLNTLSLGQKQINRDLLEELETHLLLADIGVAVTQQIIGQLTERLEGQQLNDPEALAAVLRKSLLAVLEPCSQVLDIPKQDKPFVILVVGINGAGKTTTIGKLAKKLQAQGHSVMLAAGDTFRAAAVEQLQTWGERNQITVIAQHTGADSASVVFDALQSAQAKKMDVLIADTAGRLHTQANLMDELKKVKRIMAKLDTTAPHEVLLVLDAGTGQNALSQAQLFNEAVGVTGLALTKLDGTAKGGVIFALSQQLGIPVRFIGIGEGIDDLQEFHAEAFVDALLARV